MNSAMKDFAKVVGEGKSTNAYGGSINLSNDEPSSTIQVLLDGQAIAFPLTSEAEKQLLNACVQAPFGRGKEECLDESYRKALKVDGDQFSLGIDIFQTGLLQEIGNALCPDQNSILVAEKDKINVYAKGGFFKSHKDTPKGQNTIGSLVVVLPSQFEGGDLVVAGPKGGKPAVFSWPDKDRSAFPQLSSMACYNG